MDGIGASTPSTAEPRPATGPSAPVASPSKPGIDWRWILPRLLIVLPLIQLWAVLTSGIAAPDVSDYYYLFVHAEMVRTGETLYWAWPDYGPHYMSTPELRYPLGRMPYPPFLTPLLSLLTPLGVTTFAIVWAILLWAAYWAYAACLGKMSSGRISLPATLGWGFAMLVVTLRGAHSAINLGNVDPLLWALVGAALAFPAWRGFGFMAVALVKLYGAWPLVVATARRDWRTVRAAVVTGVAAVAISVLIVGPGRFAAEFAGWFEHMFPVVGQGTFNSYNLSVSFFFLRIARWLGWEYVTGPLALAPRLFLTVIGIATPLLAAWISRRGRRELQYAVVLCVAVFFAPLAWNFYLPLLLAPVALAIGGRGRRKEI